MNEQCKDCMHRTVCAYRKRYKDAVELYEKAREECTKYPCFKCDIKCTQYRQEVLRPREILNARGSENVSS